MDSGPGDEMLLLAVAERDIGAFRTLYERHAGWPAIRLARRCNDRDLVADAIGDTFVAVWQKPRGFHGAQARAAGRALGPHVPGTWRRRAVLGITCGGSSSRCAWWPSPSRPAAEICPGGCPVFRDPGDDGLEASRTRPAGSRTHLGGLPRSASAARSVASMTRTGLNWENAMTATHETLARPASLGNAATAIFALLGLIDVALTAVIGSPDAPPLIVSLGVAALGLITLLSLVPARRGNRGALTAVVATRVISAVLAVPAFFLNAPAWVPAVEGFIIAATITALVLVHQQGRRPGEATP
jgi:hypothetical protein